MRRRRHRYRNPMTYSGLKASIAPAMFGAAGGVALDVAYTALAPSLPASLTGFSVYAPNLIKIAGAFGLGMAAKKFLGEQKGEAVLAGALAIQFYNLAASILGGTQGLAGLGAYMNRGMSGLGSPNPAVYIQKPMGRLGRMGRMGAYMKSPSVTMAGLPFGGLGSMGGSGTMDDMF